MTDREKEIRDAERKVLAECRSWRRKAQKKLAGMSPEEQQAYWDRQEEELRANGVRFASPRRRPDRGDIAGLFDDIQSLPPNLTAEVLDFVGYLKQKNQEETSGGGAAAGTGKPAAFPLFTKATG